MKKILQVRVKNFKRFNSYNVDFKPDVNVLIGDNETGKSSLLLAIDLVLSGSRTKVENYGLHNLFNADAVFKFLNGQKTIANLPEMFIEVYLDEMNDFNVFGKNNSLDRNFNGLRMTCKPDDRYHEEIRAVLKQADANFPFEFYSISFNTFADQAYSSHRNYLHHVLIDNSQINNEYAMREYIRSLYRVNVAGSEKHVHQNEYRKYKTKFKQDVLQDINRRLEDYSFAVKSGVRDNLETDLTLMEGDIAIDNKGKGRQCFIKTHFALSKGSEKMDLVLLEEPENHLSHHHMKLLIKSITDAKRIQLFITTHNTMISTRLDLRNSILIHRSASLKPLVLKDLPPDTAKFFIKAPDNNVVEFILSKKVILVEGDAEYMLMEEFYKNVSGTTLDQDQVHVISVGGISFKRYLDIAMVLKIRTAVIRDNDGDYQRHCVDGYAEYQGEHLKIYGDKNDQRRTFEIALYEDNKLICDELFSGKRKKLSVLDYMLCNKSDSAYTLADKKTGLVKAPSYIREAIEWIRG